MMPDQSTRRAPSSTSGGQWSLLWNEESQSWQINAGESSNNPEIISQIISNNPAIIWQIICLCWFPNRISQPLQMAVSQYLRTVSSMISNRLHTVFTARNVELEFWCQEVSVSASDSEASDSVKMKSWILNWSEKFWFQNRTRRFRRIDMTQHEDQFEVKEQKTLIMRQFMQLKLYSALSRVLTAR